MFFYEMCTSRVYKENCGNHAGLTNIHQHLHLMKTQNGPGISVYMITQNDTKFCYTSFVHATPRDFADFETKKKKRTKPEICRASLNTYIIPWYTVHNMGREDASLTVCEVWVHKLFLHNKLLFQLTQTYSLKRSLPYCLIFFLIIWSFYGRKYLVLKIWFLQLSKVGQA